MQNLIHWLLTPPGEPESSPNAFSARTIAAIMLAAFVPVLAILVYNLLTGDIPIIPGVSALLILITYSVARLGYAQLARGAFGMMLAVLPILLVVITPPIHISVIVAMSTASMVMAAVLLTPRIVLWIVALQTIMVAVASVHLPTMIAADDALNLVMSVFLIGIASLTLAVFHQRQGDRTPPDGLGAQSDLMKVLIDRLPAAIVTAQNGQIIYVNQTAARLLGYDTPQEMISTNLKAHVEGEVDSITSKFSVKEDETLKVEFTQTFKRANGDHVLLKVLAKPAITPRGISNIYTLTPMRDRTLTEKDAVELISQMVDGYMYIVPRTFDDQDIFTRLNDAKSLFKGMSGQSIKTVSD